MAAGYDVGACQHSWGFGGTGMKSTGRNYEAYPSKDNKLPYGKVSYKKMIFDIENISPLSLSQI